MASVGHAGKHKAQPTQSSARITATNWGGAAGMRGISVLMIWAIAVAVWMPPGGHKLIGTSSSAMALA